MSFNGHFTPCMSPRSTMHHTQTDYPTRTNFGPTSNIHASHVTRYRHSSTPYLPKPSLPPFQLNRPISHFNSLQNSPILPRQILNLLSLPPLPPLQLKLVPGSPPTPSATDAAHRLLPHVLDLHGPIPAWGIRDHTPETTS